MKTHILYEFGPEVLKNFWNLLAINSAMDARIPSGIFGEKILLFKVILEPKILRRSSPDGVHPSINQWSAGGKIFYKS